MGGMAKNYTVQYRDKANQRPPREEAFDRFEPLYETLKSIDRRASSDVINVHLPEHATVKERERIMALGYRIH
jgi:hypothetical protein